MSKNHRLEPNEVTFRPSSAEATSSSGLGPRHSGRPALGVAVAFVAIVVGALLAAVLRGPASHLPTPPAASLAMRASSRLHLSPLPPVPMPGFRLADQYGTALTSRSFGRRAVLFVFLDKESERDDASIAKMLEDTNAQLGTTRARVWLVGVDIAKPGSAPSRLSKLRLVNWRLLTGGPGPITKLLNDLGMDFQEVDDDLQKGEVPAIFAAPGDSERYSAQLEATIDAKSADDEARAVASLLRSLLG
jgi:hypothetical protein